MRVLQPSKNHNQSSVSDKSVADKSVFDFPDDTSDDAPRLVTRRKNLSRSKMKKRGQTEKTKEKENSTLNPPLTQPLSGNNLICPICRFQFSEDVSEDSKAIHISKCSNGDSSIQSKVEPQATDQPSSSKMPSSSITVVTEMPDKPSCSKDTASENTCPVCGAVFDGSSSAREKEIHINKCLDVSASDDGKTLLEQTRSDELLARSLQQGDTIGPFTETLRHCQVCLKVKFFRCRFSCLKSYSAFSLACGCFCMFSWNFKSEMAHQNLGQKLGIYPQTSIFKQREKPF